MQFVEERKCDIPVVGGVSQVLQQLLRLLERVSNHWINQLVCSDV